MYKKEVRRALVKVLFKFLIIPCCVILSVHRFFESFTITYFTTLVLISLLTYIWLKPNIKHKQSLNKLKTIGNQIEGYIERAFDDDIKNSWEKGLGLIDDVQYFMWVNASRKGLEILVISKENQGSCIIPWNDIQMLKHQHYFDGEDPIALIEIGIANNPIQIFTPWCESFNELVPDIVGVS